MHELMHDYYIISATTKLADSVKAHRDELIKQSTILLEDGIYHRSIHHNMGYPISLKLYRAYYFRPVRWFVGLFVFINLMLSFFEYPSSMSLSSDYRFRDITWHLPELKCGVTEGIEIICLIVFLVDCISFLCLLGYRRSCCSYSQLWFMLYLIVIIYSLIEICATLTFCVTSKQEGIGYTLRLRRFFRPVFLFFASSMMKNFVKAAISTLPHIFKVFILLALHIYMFAMLGLLVFPRPPFPTNGTNDTAYPTPFGHVIPWLNYSDATIITDYSHYEHLESMHYFSSTVDALINLLVLLTTANNPDMMIPIYQFNRFSALYFILFFLIGASIIFNLLIVATYNQFKESFERSLKVLFFRRRVGFKAAFEILKNDDDIPFGSETMLKLLEELKCRIPKTHISLIEHKIKCEMKGHIEPDWILFQDIFNVVFPIMKEDDDDKDVNTAAAAKEDKPINENDYPTAQESDKDHDKDAVQVNVPQESNGAPSTCVAKVLHFIRKVIHHQICSTISHFISIVNVILITIELEIAYDKSFKTDSRLAYYNLIFIIYYTIEVFLKVITINCACKNCKQCFTTVTCIIILFDLLITGILIVLELLVVILYDFPFHVHDPILDLNSLNIFSRLLGIVTILRLFRLIIQINSLRFLVFTLINLLWNLRGFFGVMIIIYYFFAFLGMELFYNVDGPSDPKSSCASDYDHLHYYANCFHDFASSLVTLWNIMIVNNWFIFLNKFACDSFLGTWAKLYFIAWWIISAILVDLFISFVLEIFAIRWKKKHKRNSSKCNKLCISESWKSYCEGNEVQTLTSLAQGWSEVRNNNNLYICMNEELPSKAKLKKILLT